MSELGSFIRASRESITPAQVGLPEGARRRTPGLRRSELATLGGISVEYLTRLEQGRDRHPSAQVLGALADALRLSAGDRLHLRRLAKSSMGGQPLCEAVRPSHEVRASIRAMLDRLEPTPAVVLNRLGDVLARTTGYERLTAPVGLLDGDSPNVIRFAFTDDRARAAYPDWDRVADDLVAGLKSAAPPSDPHITDLAEELTITAGAPFTERWQAPPRLSGGTGSVRLAHPEAGELRLIYEALELPDGGGERLIFYLPADDATSAALDGLTGRHRRHPGDLRVVSG